MMNETALTRMDSYAAKIATKGMPTAERKFPGTFRKNDRFTGVEFDLEEADRIAADYLN